MEITDTLALLGRLKKALAYWNPPFRYEPEGGIIVDRHGSRIIDVRGWGRLTGTGSGGLGMRDTEAEKIQDDVGESVAAFLNTNC
jgi:hypothetical protein